MKIAVLVPCFWQSRLQAGDLSSHLYNAWLADLIRQGQAPGLALAHQATNILFDWMLSALFRIAGAGAAQRVSVAIAVLVFVWGSFAFVSAVAGGRAWRMLPVIAILAEMDALPGMSQEAVPDRTPIAGQIAGHACGHHLFGTGAVASAVAIKSWLESSGTKGQIRVYGTPAEEGGGGKILMLERGAFDGVHAALMVHPTPTEDLYPRVSAVAHMRVHYEGRESHAAIAPELGLT